MPRPAERAARSDPAGVQAAMEAFLAAARQPVLQEPGELPFPLQPGQFDYAAKAGVLLVSAWDESRQLHRRVLGIAESRPGRLTLSIERFGGRPGLVVLYDASKPASAPLRKQGERHHFREQIRGLLRKQFPGWRLLDLSADLDLEHSLSANYPRALLRQGRCGIAAIGAAPGPAEPNHALTYGLIWLDYLRRREPDLQIGTLALFLPAPALTATALRLRWLQGAQFRLFTYSREGRSQEVDLADHGNLHTELQLAEPYLPSPLHPEAQVTAKGVRLRGLQLPRCTAEALPAMLEAVSSLRCAGAQNRLHPFYARRPEGWLESQIRIHLESVDATLRPAPLYGQVVSVAGVDRGIADLLAVDWRGRLSVMEIKAEEDIHLPLQALDYWMRIAHHAAQDDFHRARYFPGLTLSLEAPTLLLVAPALSFHPATETILRFFSSKITMERLGLALEWRQIVRVLFRYRGAERPA